MKEMSMNSLSEKELEDIICEEPGYLAGEEHDLSGVIARQVRLPHGILDILGFRRMKRGPHLHSIYPQIIIVELKARRLSQEDIAQVSRYTYDILFILGDGAIGISQDAYFAKNITQRERLLADAAADCLGLYRAVGKHPFQDTSILPVLIGKKPTNKKVLISALGAGIEVFEWTFDNNHLNIELADSIEYEREMYQTGTPWWPALKELVYDAVTDMLDFRLMDHNSCYGASTN